MFLSLHDSAHSHSSGDGAPDPDDEASSTLGPAPTSPRRACAPARLFLLSFRDTSAPKSTGFPQPLRSGSPFFKKRGKRFINKGVLTEKNRTVELDATPGSTWLKPPDFPEGAGETRRRGAARPRPLGRSFQPLCVTLGTARSPAPSTATSATAPAAARAAPSSPARALRCPPSGARPPATPVQQRPVLPTAFSRCFSLATWSRPRSPPAANAHLWSRHSQTIPLSREEKRAKTVLRGHLQDAATCGMRPPAGRCGLCRLWLNSA